MTATIKCTFNDTTISLAPQPDDLLAALSAVPAEEHERVKAELVEVRHQRDRAEKTAAERGESLDTLDAERDALQATVDRMREWLAGTTDSWSDGKAWRAAREQLRAALDAPAPQRITLDQIRKGDTIRAEYVSTYGTRTSIEGVANRQIIGGAWQTEDHDTLAAPDQEWTYTLIHRPEEPTFALPTEAGAKIACSQAGQERTFTLWTDGASLYWIDDDERYIVRNGTEIMRGFTGHRLVREGE